MRSRHLAALCLLPILLAPAHAEYLCRFAGETPSVDGDLSDPAWAAAAPIPIRFPLDPADARPPPMTRARLLWDRDFLYAGFECVDSDIRPYSRNPDDLLWKGDVVELFVKTDPDKPAYFEFVIAPNGALFDARHPRRAVGKIDPARRWNSGARVAARARADGSGYTVEIAVPFAALGSAPMARRALIWSFAAFRCDYSATSTDPVFLMSIPVSSTGNFHYYEGYTPLVFTQDENPIR